MRNSISVTKKRGGYEEFIQQHPTGYIIWDKVNGNNDFNDCELAWTSFDIPTTIFYFMWAGMRQGISLREGKTMQGNKRLNEKRIHPTQKPLALHQWTLEKFAKAGNIIYSPNMGSQNDRVAAYKLGFDYYGNEIDERHYDDGCERFKQLTSEPLFANQPL